MNKKGFTVVELIVSFALVMMVVIMLLQIVTMVKTLYVDAGIKTELLSKQAIMNRKISEQFHLKSIKAAMRCGRGCLTFIYEDDSSSTLTIDKEKGIFSFINNDHGSINYTIKLLSGSQFGNIEISNETVLNVSDGKDNSMIHIKIPVKHSLVEGDYGINLVYQYDSRITAISDIVYDDQNTNEGGTIVLKGSSDMTHSSVLPYQDPGYYVIDSKGDLCTPNGSNTCGVEITGEVGNNPNTTYTLNFKLKKDGVVVDEKIRRVLVLNTSTNFDYTKERQMFTVSQKGLYKVELWGAAKDDQTKGSYTSGEVQLEKSENLYLYVGEKGSENTFNQGATDLRVKGGDVNDTNSTASRILAASGGLGDSFPLSNAKEFNNITSISNTKSMPNPRGSSNITGNPGHGFARITLVSVTS